MIFVTVGTQLPFDRLVSAMDAWAASATGVKVVAQIGPSLLTPANVEWKDFFSVEECRQHVMDADLIVAHAGMGSILTALELGKRLIIMPRRSALQEHRNDHQVATAKRLQEQGRALVVYHENELLAELAKFQAIEPPAPISDTASADLIATLRAFSRSDEPRTWRMGSGLVGGSKSIWDPRYVDLPSASAKLEGIVPDSAVSNIGWSARVAQEPKPSLSRERRRSSQRPRGTMSSRIRDVIWLIGPVGNNPIETQTSRSLLDLPIRQGQTLMEAWRDELASVLGAFARGAGVRMVVSANGVNPPLSPQDRAIGISSERDPQALRGTGGVLRDIASQYEPDDVMLVVLGTQLLMDSLESVIEGLDSANGDVNLLMDPSGAASNVMMAQCDAFDEISNVGFVDLKEQALPAMARHGAVRVRRMSRPTSQPIRTAKDYLDAVQLHAGLRDQGQSELAFPFQERWRANFSIVEDGAGVHPEASVMNSVVLSGARVEAGSLGRSIGRLLWWGRPRW